DQDRTILSGTMAGTTIANAIATLQATYCRSIGVQFMHIDDQAVRIWLQERMEQTQNRLELTSEQQRRILRKLTDAVEFEAFLQKKYVGAKSFSLEGGESLIPLLDLAIEEGGQQGIDEIVLGMAHRGRLNVLANIMGKRPAEIFREFDDVDPEVNMGRGDVKYHLGYSNDWQSESGQNVHLSLSFNPSHLEFVNAVVMGRVRAKQDRRGDDTRCRGMGILIHGDAAFIGEGVVQETLNMSDLAGYRVGGILHVIVNNQLGFTTDPNDSRSSRYATDVAKMIESPIFHVNGEDPEAVAQVVKLAMAFRNKFQRDVVIDMYCYRRFGHNEGDEPRFTQPTMYETIRKRPSVRRAYLERLLKHSDISKDEADALAEQRRAWLDSELDDARSDSFKLSVNAFAGVWKGYVGGAEDNVPDVDTGISAEMASKLLNHLAHVPEGFNLNSKLKRLVAQRSDMASSQRMLDWSTAESLAFGSILLEGHRVRLTGQDSERGTFSQRHSVWHDTNTGETYTALANLSDQQAPVEIYNSPLSEAGVLGFEYGYSLDWPEGLTLWEAQFGDFVNAGQVIIDQFISSGEDKWQRLCALVMLLPHGFEGAGPEHSSARLERFLALAAEDNLQIVNATTPAQYFHVLRRQVKRNWRKPLIIMTPKSLLRSARAVSPLSDFTQGQFQRILPDPDIDPATAKRILLCSGKVYYDLLHERREIEYEDVAIIRLEQLYPLREEDLHAVLDPYPDGTHIYWVQEEPENMGAWRYLRGKFGFLMLERFPFYGICRPESASPATGSRSSHNIEQANILKTAFLPRSDI
ncbi:MAG: 2-oxoglutarate dehydrogenase E1 component, partial [Deinococcota bacterium]